MALWVPKRGTKVPSSSLTGARGAPRAACPASLVVRAVRDGGVVELLVDVDENRVAFYLAGVDGQRGHHGNADRLAGSQVEPGVMRRADQGVVILHGALVQGLLLVSAGVVHRTDVVVVQAHQADRLSQPLHEQGFARLQVVEVGDDDKSHDYFLPLTGRRRAGWLPRTSIQPFRSRAGGGPPPLPRQGGVRGGRPGGCKGGRAGGGFRRAGTAASPVRRPAR